MRTSLWRGPAMLLAALLVPMAAGNSLHFDDPRGDQAPFPDFLDILAVDFLDDGTTLAVSVRLAEAPPGTPSTVYDILFESPTQGHNIGCFLGTTDPTEPGAGANCFAYRYDKGAPLGPTKDYRGLHFEVERSNATLRWTFPLDTMEEEPGTELRLVRVLARLGVSDDRGGDLAAGDPQDIAASADAYVMPEPQPEPVEASESPSTVAAERSTRGKAAPAAPAPLAALALLGVTLGARRTFRRS